MDIIPEHNEMIVAIPRPQTVELHDNSEDDLALSPSWLNGRPSSCADERRRRGCFAQASTSRAELVRPGAARLEVGSLPYTPCVSMYRLCKLGCVKMLCFGDCRRPLDRWTRVQQKLSVQVALE